jgi:hypothetical protein
MQQSRQQIEPNTALSGKQSLCASLSASSRLYVPCLAICSCDLTVFVRTVASSFAPSFPATSLDLPCYLGLPWLRRRFQPVPPLPAAVFCRLQFWLCSSGLPKPRM